jgi:hypothetical protein
MSWATFTFDQSWDFDVPPERLWAACADTGSFRHWWPWLRRFDPVPLECGARTHAAIGPPLPYLLNVDLLVTAVEPERRVEVDVSGDATGPARLEVGSTSAGSFARLAWELHVERRFLRAGARLARPVLQWGHDWVVANGVDQFRTSALRVNKSA